MAAGEQMAGGADIAVVHQPNARQGDMRPLGQGRDNAFEALVHRANLSQFKEAFLERFKLWLIIRC